ncbi:tRNA (5-methylaminomethyl-2-thiouridine)(34)-methyltransferase MnmD [Apibacter sp. HY039]|uniref:tRNA (5-methylaminomethyl-2-thiouridine)(34)-methyltransferase MnmD n=1 Tax=Apibacter sp. HY039 TaxID=2501476 RepID=UPI0021075819|nr:tRNA (5-methylaminomethyl-2-thiouridine)(34)-methyltransferase MnmD [Apibacter sp. HY039]
MKNTNQIMLERIIITTTEGSKTLHIPEWNECYHSQHGILQEASHVFLDQGFDQIDSDVFSILEMGFGTGLNAFLTCYKAQEENKKITYFTLEKYPVEEKELRELEYWKLINKGNAEETYFNLHQAPWGELTEINENFSIMRYNSDFFELINLPVSSIDLVYYDAFGARVQPELWENEIFSQLYGTMSEGALLTTYSSKGSARRAMQHAGFKVEKKEGPKGKREMVNAWKI